ncbi:MAG: NADP-dependent oxidoreductase [Planctomycetaceae bacterium]|nr:NADP-dependent oxidoreductase [Planctomycetaceae bacterium]
MEYRNLGSCGAKVSPVCLGTMMFGLQTSEADSINIIHKAHDLGINFVDTANMYAGGESEVITGKAIADRRDQIILATKGRQKMGDGPNDQGSSRVHLMKALDDSLKRLNTDYVDVYYAHAPDYDTPIEETMRALDDMVRSGRVRYIACSNYRAWRLCEAIWTSKHLNLHSFCAVQPLYNIVNRDIEVELLPLCQEYGIGVVSYSPLARGILTGKYKKFGEYPEGSRASRSDPRMVQAELREESIAISQQINEYCENKGCGTSHFSLAWCLANPILTSLIIGPKSIEQFEDNMNCLDVTITDQDEAFINSLVPIGEHSGKGFQDTAYPITGRGR